MIPYLITYAIVLILTAYAQATYNKNKKMSYLISFICILLLSTFAALRGLNVGKDISVYGTKIFDLANDYENLIDYIGTGKAEIGYMLINFIVSRIFGNIHALFFLLEFFNIACIYRIAYRDRNNGTFIFYILTYLLLWNNASFNIIRQSISMIIILYSYTFLEQKKIKHYIASVAIAFLFHKSSIIALINPLLSKLTDDKKIKTRYLAALSIVYVILIINIRSIMSFLITVFPTFKYYYNYLDRPGNFSLAYFLTICLILITTVVFSKYMNEKKNCNLLTCSVFLFTLLYTTSLSFEYGYRIAYPFILYYVYLIPRIDNSLEKHNGRTFFRIAIICVLLIHWFLRCSYYDATIPYTWFWQ